MPKFHVRDSFELPELKLFVLAGTILEGTIKAGMHAHVRCNSQPMISARINRIEFVLRNATEGIEDVALCFPWDSDEAKLMKTLSVKDEDIEITTEV